jgi:Skp family chaperone for outer membrane proteins
MSSDFLERDATYQMIKKNIPREHLMNMLPAYAHIIKNAGGAYENTHHSRSDRSFESSENIQRPDIYYSHSAKDGSEDQVLPYYEVYTPKKVKLYNVIERIPPAQAELENAQRGVKAQLDSMQRELEVGLLELEQQLRAQLERGDIIKERFDLELQKARQESQARLVQAEQIMISKIEDESFKVEERVLTEEEYEVVKGSDSIVSAVPFYDTRIMKTCVVGDKLLYEYTMNISHIPLIPIPYLHTGTPYPMSAARPLVGKQQEINKAHQIMIHNANVASNFRWKYVIGEIDEDTWESYVASPNALLPYNPGYSPNGPEPIFPQPINNAFFTVEQDSKSDMEYMAGIHPPSMGISSGSDETFRGFLARDEFATRRIKSWIGNVFEPALEHIGKVFQELAKDTYTVHKIFRIVQPNPTGGIDQHEFEVNVPIYDDYGQEIGRYNDYKTSQYDIRIIAGSTLPVNRWAVLEEYKQYLELGIIDDIAFLNETDIKNKDAIIARKSALAQLEGQVNQLEEQLSDAEGTIETLQRQLVQAGIKDQIKNAVIEIDRSKTETKSQETIVQERMRDALKQGNREIELAKKQAQDEIKKASNTGSDNSKQ